MRPWMPWTAFWIAVVLASAAAIVEGSELAGLAAIALFVAAVLALFTDQFRG